MKALGRRIALRCNDRKDYHNKDGDKMGAAANGPPDRPLNR